MGLFTFLLLMTSSSCLFITSSASATCEEAETSAIKLDLLKQCIATAKDLYPKCSDTSEAKNCSSKDKSLAHLNVALDLIKAAKVSCRPCPEPKVIVMNDRPLDCLDVLAMDFNKSGVYQIWPKGRGISPRKSIDVYCDMDTDKGGWTVIQRRGLFSNAVDFYQSWDTYKKGFGDLKQEFWLGNEKIFALTNQGVYAARFELVGREKEYRYAEYNSFFIGDEFSGYVLHVQNYTGNATDAMNYHNGMMFSTYDRQNDRRSVKDSCTKMYRAAFWYSPRCGYANLNGVYQPGVSNDGKSVWWFGWKGYDCLHSVEVKIRRKYA